MAPHKRRDRLRKLIRRYGHTAIANVTGTASSAIARFQADLPISKRTEALIERAFRELGDDLGLSPGTRAQPHRTLTQPSERPNLRRVK